MGYWNCRKREPWLVGYEHANGYLDRLIYVGAKLLGRLEGKLSKDNSECLKRERLSGRAWTCLSHQAWNATENYLHSLWLQLEGARWHSGRYRWLPEGKNWWELELTLPRNWIYSLLVDIEEYLASQTTPGYWRSWMVTPWVQMLNNLNGRSLNTAVGNTGKVIINKTAASIFLY